MNTICLIIGIICWLFIGAASFLWYLKRVIGVEITNKDLYISLLASVVGPTFVLYMLFLDFLERTDSKIHDIKSKINEYLWIWAAETGQDCDY